MSKALKELKVYNELPELLKDKIESYQDAYANSNNQQLNRALNITINNINYRVQESEFLFQKLEKIISDLIPDMLAESKKLLGQQNIINKVRLNQAEKLAELRIKEVIPPNEFDNTAADPIAIMNSGWYTKLLYKSSLKKKSWKNSLTITPILDNEKQIGESTIDLRLGTKFEVDMRTRKPFFDPLSDKRPIETFFQDTYRNFGEKFILYPQQLVLASTFEYVKLPNDLFGIVFTRSSWNRLGLNISSVLQSGYAGVINLELINNSSNPIALYPGLRIVQLILFSVDGEEREAYYRDFISKYVANADPDLSSISEDEDLQVLKDKFPINS